MRHILQNIKALQQVINKDRRLLILIAVLILLPLIIMSVYVVNKKEPKAFASAPTNIHTTRTSTVAAEICFDTDLPVEASLQCAIGLQGVKFFCGKDAEPQTSRCLKTSDFDVTLNSGVGYYVFIKTGQEQDSLAYLRASPDDPRFSLDMNSFTEEVLWICQNEAGFDPALDINQDGCVNLADMEEFY